MLFVSKLFFFWTTLYFLKNAVHYCLETFFIGSDLQRYLPSSYHPEVLWYGDARRYKLRFRFPFRAASDQHECSNCKPSLPDVAAGRVPAGNTHCSRPPEGTLRRQAGARPPRHHQGEKGRKEWGSRLPATGSGLEPAQLQQVPLSAPTLTEGCSRLQVPRGMGPFVQITAFPPLQCFSAKEVNPSLLNVPQLSC